MRLVTSYIEIKEYDSKGNLLSKRTESESKHGFESKSDCHGYTFTEGDLWINDDQVEKILKNDNYSRNVPKASADAVIYKDKKTNAVVHSAKKNTSGTYDNDAGVLTLEKNKSIVKASRGLTDMSNPKNYEFVDKKTPNKVVNATTGTVGGKFRYMSAAQVKALLATKTPTTTPKKPTTTSP